MSGLSQASFLRICSPSRHTSKVYARHLPLIKKLCRNGIWNTMKNRKLNLIELKAFSSCYKVAESTIRSWNQNLLDDPDWLPLHRRTIDADRIINEEDEKVIAELIRQIIEDQDYILSNDLVKRIAVRYYYSKHEPNFRKQFTASNKWITKFKRKYRFSRRKFHLKRRPNISTNAVIQFLELTGNIFTNVSRNHILNVDETNWRVADCGEYTWAKTGQESVSINSNVSEKSSFTMLATIDATGKVFPPVLIAKGQTELAESNWFGQGRNILNSQDNVEVLENPFYNMSASRFSEKQYLQPVSVTDHSDSGWTNQTTWLNYLYKLRFDWCKPQEDSDFYDESNKLYLFCDSFPVHFSIESQKFAQLLNIQLVRIPEGTTDTFQALDCRIFGVLKNHARTFLNLQISKEIFERYDIDDAIQSVHKKHLTI